MATEDFTTYTESDPGADISITASQITYTSLATRNSESYVYDDKGANHFSGDFAHKLMYKYTAASDNSFTYPWMLANLVDDGKGIADASGDSLQVGIYKPTGSSLYIVIREVDGGTSYTATTYDLTVSTDYYPLVDRDEGIGTYGQLRMRVYSDADYTSLLNTQTLSLHTSKKDFRYVYPLNTYNSGLVALQSGVVSNLDLQEAAGTTIPVFVNHYRNQGIM